jgi:tetratricopeptide (TPR) repeat protein
MTAQTAARVLVGAALALCVSVGAAADSLAATFARANDAFGRGDYDAAIAGYETLRQAGVDDPDVSFNLGSAHARAGHLGEAIRAYEHTLRLSPRDADARTALSAVKQALGQRQAARSGEAIVATRPPLAEALFGRVSDDELSITLLVSTALLFACLLVLRAERAEAGRLALGIAAALSALLAASSGFGLGIKTHWGKDGTQAVIVREQAALREGPDEAAIRSAELPEGTRVWALEHERDFVRVETPTGQVGYVSARAVGEI